MSGIKNNEKVTYKYGDGEKILIVDDEEFFLNAFSESLTRLGYNVHSVSNSPDALKAIKNAPEGYDLLITDQTMPEMTGLQLIEKSRKINNSIRIILCTGFSEVVSEDSAEYYGVDRFLMKPVSMIDLAKTVNELVS